MPRVRVIFELSMPGVASWDGRWSGEGRAYNRVRQIDAARAVELGMPNSWTHRWSDGWCAEVSARLMNKGERTPKSDGFSGYDWMIDNIIARGTPYALGGTS